MEINVTPIRGVILAVLLVGFFFFGGFDMPDGVSGRRFTKAWSFCIIMFVVGATKVSIVDHWAGTVERTNLRFFYIILGVILMVVALVWQSMLRTNVERAVEKGLVFFGPRVESVVFAESWRNEL